MLKDFVQFLKEFKVVSLAIAFVMGAAATSLINSLVKDIIMPLLSPLLSNGSWKDAALHMGPISIAYGSFLAELINFVILGFIIFLVVRKILKIEHDEAKK